MTKLLSDRVKKIPATQVSADRYSFLKLSEAEPDLGVPSSNGYVLASQTDGTRSWVSALSAVIAPGSDGQIIYNNGGSLGGTSDITFDDANNDLKFADNAKAVFGAGSDLQIYHDGSHSYINDAGTGELRIQANGALDINKYTGENMARFFADGAVELYFDNSKKFETTSAGASVTGNLVVSGDLTISGTTTTVNTTNLDVEDAVITLNTGQATPLNDIGLLFQRYSSANSTNYNVGIAWEEGSDRLVFGKTPEDGADNDISFSQEWMTITGAGNVGIGTNSPSKPFHVRQSGTDTYGSGIALFEYYDTDDTATRYQFSLGTSQFASFKSFVTGASSDFLIVDQDNASGRLAFQVQGNAGSIEAFAVESTGKVGIGTTSPKERLHLNGSITMPIQYGIRNNLYFDGGWKTLAAGDGFAITHGGTNGDTLFFASTTSAGAGADSSVAVANRFVLLSNGNFGIGTDTPSNLLHVKSAFGTNNIKIDTTTVGSLLLGSTGASVGGANPYRAVIQTDNGNLDLSFASSSGRIYFEGSSNVGIGTTSPVSKLHVDGDFAFASDGSGSNWLKWQRNASNNWKLTSDGVGDVMQIVGNLLTIPQDVTIQRGGLDIERTFLSAAPALGITETWNDAGTTFTAIQTNITDTASNAASLLMDLRVGGSSKFSIGKLGNKINFTDSNYGAAYVAASGARIDFSPGAANGAIAAAIDFAGRFCAVSTLQIGSHDQANAKVVLARDADDVLALRRSTNAQTFNLYNTYTDASNYERGTFKWDTNVLEIGTEALGTGTRRNIKLNYTTTIDGGSRTNIPALSITNVGAGNGGLLVGQLQVGYQQDWTRLTAFYTANKALAYNHGGTGVSNQGAHRFSTDTTFGGWVGANGSVVDIKAPSTISNIFQCRQSDEAIVLNVDYSGFITIANISTQAAETATLATVTQTAIASFAAATYGSGKFVIQATDTVSGEVHITELLVVHDGTTAYATEYGTIHTGANPLATYEVDINTGNVRILATAASANSTTYKVTENLITA